MRIVYGAVGSTDVVGVSPIPKVGIVSTLKVDTGSTLEGSMYSICSDVHLFYLSVWCSIRTLVSELNILQWFFISIALTSTISLNISRRSVAAMIVWSHLEIVGT